MAVGTISSPAAWYNGTIAQPSWFQNAQDTINDVYNYKSATRYLWIGAAEMQATSLWTFNGHYWQATGVGDLYVPLTLFYTVSGNSSTTKRQKPTSFAIRVKPNAAGTMLVNQSYVFNLGNTSAPTTASFGTVSSLGTAQQTLTLAADSLMYQNDDQTMFLRITSAQASDQVFGVRVTYTNVIS